MDSTSEPERWRPKTHDPKCISLAGTEHGDKYCDCRVLAMVGDEEIARIRREAHLTNG